MASLGRCCRGWAAYPQLQPEFACGVAVLGAPILVGSTLVGFSFTTISRVDPDGSA